MNKVLASKFSNFMPTSTTTIESSKSSNSSHSSHSEDRSAALSGNMKPTPATTTQQQKCHLNELGFRFVEKCIETIETRGLDDQGLYRVGGVNSRVSRLLQICLDRKNHNLKTGQVTLPDISDPSEWETKTITSALKSYLRNLSEPLMTHNLHPSIIGAAKIENPEARTLEIKNLIQQLPFENFTLLKMLVEHLKNVASHSDKNLMTVSNLSICFAPTLLQGPEESALSIMEIKYSNVIANTLIEEYDSIFEDHRMDQPQDLYHQNLSQPIRYAPSISHDDQFSLGLPSQQYQTNSSNQVPQTNYYNKPFKCQNGSNDLAQFALKCYDQTSRTTSFISATSIPPIDIRPINDLKTYSFDQALMVPSSDQSYQQMSGSMGNSLNYVEYLGSQTSSQPNSINYSSNSLNNPNVGDQQYNNQNPINNFHYTYNSLNSKMPYRSEKVITLYACVADTESELSFGPNEMITDVQTSAEFGWLVGTLERNGQRGLLPENYVKYI